MSSSASAAISANWRKRPSTAAKPAAKKANQEPMPAAAVGGLAVSSVEALVDVFDQQPYMISVTRMAELRAMGGAWARVMERADRFEQAQAVAQAQTVFECDQPLVGVNCGGRLYLGGSDAVAGTPLSLEIWAMILMKLEARDRLSFSYASKDCLALQRSLVERLIFGHSAPTGSTVLRTARKRTEQVCGPKAALELEQLLATPRCREIVVGRPQFGCSTPGQLPSWYYSRVVAKALDRCPGKVALRMTQLRESGQRGFVHRVYCCPKDESYLAVDKLSCLVVSTKHDLLGVLKTICNNAQLGGNLPTGRICPILFECKEDFSFYHPPDWIEQGISKWNWRFGLDTTRQMSAFFQGIFVKSSADFERFFPPATSGIRTMMSSNLNQLSPLFTVMFPIYVDPKATATNPEDWSRAERYHPAYFEKDDAATLIDRLAEVDKSLCFKNAPRYQ